MHEENEPIGLKEIMYKIISQAVGEASICWSEQPKGEFDAEKAVDISNRAVDEIVASIEHRWFDTTFEEIFQQERTY